MTLDTKPPFESKQAASKVIFEREYGTTPYISIIRMMQEELGISRPVAVTYYSIFEREKVPPNVTLRVTEEELEIARKAVEDELIEFRDSGISVLRNNGLVIKYKDGSPSDIIRMGFEHAFALAIDAINKSRGNPE